MLRISFADNSDQRLVETLRTKGPRIIAVLMTKLNALMIQLQSYIVSNKLSGQVLARRTGILAGSIRAIPATVEGAKIVAAVEGGGGPAFYGRIHEEGPEQGAYPIVAVRARALSFVMGGKQVFVKSVMHPAVRMRPFMAPSLDENAATIEAELRAAVDQEINQP
jgi:hypothetical protein